MGWPTSSAVKTISCACAVRSDSHASDSDAHTNDLIRALFKMGVPSAMGDTIDQDTAELLVTEFGHNFTRVSASDVEIDVQELDARCRDQAVQAGADHVGTRHLGSGLCGALSRRSVAGGKEARRITGAA